MPEDKSEGTIIPPEKAGKLVEKTSNVHSVERTQRRELYIGPLPPPELLAKYNNAFPGGAERVFKLIESQSNHRIEIETIAIKSGASDSNKGLNYGLTVAIVGLLVTAFLGYVNQGTAAAIVGAIDLAALVSVFIYGKARQSVERVQKAKSMAEIAKGMPHAEHDEDTQTKYNEKDS
ncbi:MAG: DUF2335 domain-containing protein [Dehalococcoidia bacterium]